MTTLGIVSITGEGFGSYHIETDTDKGDDATFAVVNSNGKVFGRVYQTYDGAAACAELLAEGYWQE